MVTLAGLEAYYKFNDDGTDSSGHSRTLTFSGTEAYTTGKFNNGYSLPGGDANFATGPTDSVLTFAGSGAAYTIAVWVNFASLSGEQTIVEKFVGAAGPGWTLTKLAGQEFRFGGNGPGFVNTAALATSGSFLHLVVRSDGTTIEMFLNGSSIGTGTGTISPTSNPLLIGERQGVQSHPVNGVIDEVSLWSRGLLDSDISQLYNSGSGLELENFNPAPIPASSTPFRYVRDAALVPRPSAPFRFVRDASLTSRPSAPFRWLKDTPVPNLIVNKQIVEATINVDRLAFNTVRSLSLSRFVDFTTTGISTVYTVPTGSTAIVLGLIIELRSVSTPGTDPQISLGLNAQADDILAIETVVDLQSPLDAWTNWLILSKSQAAIAGQDVKLNIQVAASATTLFADVHVIGFLIS